jgi:hypothetical protein
MTRPLWPTSIGTTFQTASEDSAQPLLRVESANRGFGGSITAHSEVALKSELLPDWPQSDQNEWPESLFSGSRAFLG